MLCNHFEQQEEDTEYDEESEMKKVSSSDDVVSDYSGVISLLIYFMFKADQVFITLLFCFFFRRGVYRK